MTRRLSLATHLRCGALALVVSATQLARTAGAEQVRVLHREGTTHGFLVLRSQEGHKIGYGDFIQTVRGEQVKLRLVFHFDDGSVDDETTVFTQHGSFQLVTNHHVQKGPSFPHPIELSIDAHSGQVTVRSTDKEGKEEVKTEHMDLPPDSRMG